MTSTTEPTTAPEDLSSGNLSSEPVEWLEVDHDTTAFPEMLEVTNRSAMPIELRVILAPGATNVVTTPALPLATVIPPLTSSEVATFEPADRSSAWSYRVEWLFELGDPAAQPSTDTYPRPLAPGVDPVVVQGFGGEYSHNDLASRYAIDFQLREGTPVVAAREGIVATIDQGFTEGAADRNLLDRGNCIRVLHSDGTYAEYLHLAPRSSQVHIGDRVTAGQVLALSGNTGYTQGPHLHFAVLANRDSQRTSIWFRFDDH